MNKRPVGKTKDAGWQIGVSRTIAVDLDTAWDFLVSDAGIEIWLGTGVELPLTTGDSYCTADGTTGEFRSVRARDRVRLTWQPPERAEPATTQIALTETATGCAFRFHSEHLTSRDEREAMRSHWKRIADAIETRLTN